MIMFRFDNKSCGDFLKLLIIAFLKSLNTGLSDEAVKVHTIKNDKDLISTVGITIRFYWT